MYEYVCIQCVLCVCLVHALVNLCLWACQAGNLAMERGWAISIDGGFRHCGSDRGVCIYVCLWVNGCISVSL